MAGTTSTVDKLAQKYTKWDLFDDGVDADTIKEGWLLPLLLLLLLLLARLVVFLFNVLLIGLLVR